MSISQDKPNGEGDTIPLGPLLTRSTRFKTLFADGMKLVEEASGYLDGPGRAEAKGLSPALTEAYSAESMRLTTRLMQIASWLLIRRAIADGEMTPAEALGDRRGGFTVQTRMTPNGIFLQLPLTLQRLTERSLRLQRRVAHLDRMISAEPAASATEPPAALAQQMELLRSAFGPLP